MGWFDDSDSDDNSKSKRTKRPLLETFHDDNDDDNVQNVTNNLFDEKEEPSKKSKLETNVTSENSSNDVVVDPLDAFMNDLSNTKTLTTQITKRSRLDMENEEEATAHWESTKTTSNTTVATIAAMETSKNHHDSNNNNNNASIQKAQMAMASTFHKAGEKNTNTHHNNNDDDYDNDDDENLQIKINTKIQQQKQNDENHYQLDNINDTITTNTKQQQQDEYKPFCKIFLSPNRIRQLNYNGNNNNNNSSSNSYGYEWRKKHDITCSIDYIDPIESFDLYGNNSDAKQPKGIKEKEQGGAYYDNEDEAIPSLFDPNILNYLDKNNFKKPTLVQAQCIPIALCGRDLIVTSHTGR